jgi:hypothetical protein
MSDAKKGGNTSMGAGSAGPSGSHQGGQVKTYLPSKPIKVKSGNKSQSTGK